jgi:hypothetical protein
LVSLRQRHTNPSWWNNGDAPTVQAWQAWNRDPELMMTLIVNFSVAVFRHGKDGIGIGF